VRTLAARLADIIEAIERIRAEAAGIPLDAFEADWRKQWLVERGVEVISEASRHLTEEMKARHPSVPWRKIAGVGNILRHEYDRIAADVLWRLAQDELALLDEVCRSELTIEQARERGQS
jgi:uncharacterized protein with HEPN domain